MNVWVGLNATKVPVNKDDLEKQVKATLVALTSQSGAVEWAGDGIIF